MKTLPAPLLADDVTTAEKLVYMWVRANPGEHSTQSLDAALGARSRSALAQLVQRGVLIEERPAVGSRPGQYRAAPQPRQRQDKTTEDQPHE